MTATLPILSSAADWFSGGLGVGASAGVGYFMIRWFFEWMGGRLDKREERVDAGMKALLDALQKRVEATEKRLALTEDRLAKTEQELRDCERKHAVSDAEITRLKAILQGQGEIRQLAAGAVAADRIDTMRKAAK